MAKLESLGLASVSKAGAATVRAVRRLFGRSTSSEQSTATQKAPNAASASPQIPGLRKTKEEQNAKPSSTESSSPQDTRPTPGETEMASQTIQQLHGTQALNHMDPGNKENRDPRVQPKSGFSSGIDGLSESVAKLEIVEDQQSDTSLKHALPAVAPLSQPATPPPWSEERPMTLEEEAERDIHLGFIEEALDMARLALRTNETPVGCVLVRNDQVIARGMNATNVTRNGTRHAEFMALSALLSYPPKTGPRTTRLKPKRPELNRMDSESVSTESSHVDEGNENGSKGHLYPYGQKIIPDERVDRKMLRECTLYVTVEPCVMCASMLRQVGIKKVFFGAVNDKFGGTGGVFSIHANSLPVEENGDTASAHPIPRTTSTPGGYPTLGTSYPPGGGDGGNVEDGYHIEGGWGRDEAVGLLRRFYVQENGRAPVPRKKEGRAARLAAMMDQDGEAPAEGGDAPGEANTDKGPFEGEEAARPSQSTAAKKELDEIDGTKDQFHKMRPQG